MKINVLVKWVSLKIFPNIKSHCHVSSENIVYMMSKILMKIYSMIFVDVFFYPRGIKLSKLWALKNPLYLRTDPLQEGGYDEYHPTGLFSLGQWPGQFSFFFVIK